MAGNGHIYEMLGIAGSSLSAFTKAGAGQKGSSSHLNPNILYMMLGVGYFLFILFKYSSAVIIGIFESLKSFAFLVINMLHPESNAL